ncbi:MAG: hypothetical protein JWO22_257 [Frankiales bacterium]|nr:hypothetical protein [Frankiales bacterium]
MIDIASLLSLQARSRRNALQAARRLRHDRGLAAEALRAAENAYRRTKSAQQ